MIGVVMAGGEGTRLRPLTALRPKPFVPILGRPCIDYAIDLLSPIGVRDVLVTTYYRPSLLIEHLGGGSSHDVGVFYSIEDEALGTAGGVAKARGLINERVVVVSGDLFVDADLRDLVAFHERSGAAVTMALTEVPNPIEYGIVGLDDDGRIVRFKEKPREEEVFSNLINAGIYVIEPEVLERVPEGRKFDFSRDLFPMLREEGSLFGHPLEGIWIDIGRPADLLRANREVARKRLRDVDGDLGRSGLVHPDARIEGTVEGASYVASRVVVERNAVVRDSFILEEVTLSQFSEVENSLVLEGSRIGEKSVLQDTIVGAGCEIRSRSKLDECVLGDCVIIPQGSWLVRQKLE